MWNLTHYVFSGIVWRYSLILALILTYYLMLIFLPFSSISEGDHVKIKSILLPYTAVACFRLITLFIIISSQFACFVFLSCVVFV